MRSAESQYIERLIEGDSGIRLLRSRNASLVVAFFLRAFKERHRQSLPSDSLESLLADFLKEHSAEDFSEEDEGLSPSDADLDQRARLLVARWCSDRVGYVRRYHDERGTPVVELSASVERLLGWLEDLEPAEFVGAESRFRDILYRLRDLSEHTTVDPEARIRELEGRRKELAAEIREIRETGEARVYTAVQITERLRELSRSSRELLADFRQVEENFRSILSTVYREQSNLEMARGQILGYTLDASQALRESPQGQTFETFWLFLAEDAGKNEINNLTTGILSRVAEQGVSWTDPFLPKLKLYLHEAGKKVIGANRLLSDRLNRVLARQDANGYRRAKELIGEIKSLSLRAIDDPPRADPFLCIDGRPEVFFPFARPLVFPPREIAFAPMARGEREIRPDQVVDLFSQFSIDEGMLIDRLRAVQDRLRGRGQVSIGDVIAEYPVEKGLAEVMAYFSIATRSESAVIRRDASETLEYAEGESTVRVTVPKVIFPC